MVPKVVVSVVLSELVLVVLMQVGIVVVWVMVMEMVMIWVIVRVMMFFPPVSGGEDCDDGGSKELC